MRLKEIKEELKSLLDEEVAEIIIPGSASNIRTKIIGKLPQGCQVSEYFDTKPAPNNNDGIKITCDKDKENDVMQVLKELELNAIKLNEAEEEIIEVPEEGIRFNAYKEEVIKALQDINLDTNPNKALNISNSLSNLYSILLAHKYNDSEQINTFMDMAEKALHELL